MKDALKELLLAVVTAAAVAAVEHLVEWGIERLKETKEKDHAEQR